MEKEELIKQADQELQWLKYYALAEVDQKIYPGKNGRNNFDPNRSPYDQFVSIGYTKKVIALDRRCAFMRATAKTPIKETPLADIVDAGGEPRNPDKNILSYLEILLLKFPEEHERIMNYFK